MKHDLLTSVQRFSATRVGFQHSRISGPLKGSTYYAGQGGYEYAQAMFAAPGSAGSDVGGTVATAWRPVGGAWSTVDIGNYSDITPTCFIPAQVAHLWNAQAPTNPCSAKWGPKQREFGDISGQLRCKIGRAHV